MMEKMMPVMMKGISSEEKEEMMLKMMPLMMAEINLTEMMPKMMATMIPVILPMFFEQMSRDENAGEKMLDTMAKVMPNVCEVIDKKVLAEKKDEMVSKLMERDNFREKMPKCFAKGMPLMVRGCFEHFLPQLTKEERQEFISSINNMMLEYGAQDFSSDDKKTLVKNL